MTLEELRRRCFSHGADDSKIYVFTDKYSADNFIEWKYDGNEDSNDFEIDFTLYGINPIQMYLQEKWLNINVNWFTPVAMNEVVAVVGYPDWDQQAKEELWEQVAEYCDNDVITTEEVWLDTQPQFKENSVEKHTG